MRGFSKFCVFVTYVASLWGLIVAVTGELASVGEFRLTLGLTALISFAANWFVMRDEVLCEERSIRIVKPTRRPKR